MPPRDLRQTLSFFVASYCVDGVRVALAYFEEWLDYDRVRPHSALGNLSLEEFVETIT